MAVSEGAHSAEGRLRKENALPQERVAKKARSSPPVSEVATQCDGFFKDGSSVEDGWPPLRDRAAGARSLTRFSGEPWGGAQASSAGLGGPGFVVFDEFGETARSTLDGTRNVTFPLREAVALAAPSFTIWSDRPREQRRECEAGEEEEEHEEQEEEEDQDDDKENDYPGRPPSRSARTPPDERRVLKSIAMMDLEDCVPSPGPSGHDSDEGDGDISDDDFVSECLAEQQIERIRNNADGRYDFVVFED